MALAAVLAPVGRIIDTQTRKSEVQVATAGQTAFTLVLATYAIGFDVLDVYVNGLKKHIFTDYIETSATTVTFNAAMLGGESVQFIANTILNNGDQAVTNAANAASSANAAALSQAASATSEANANQSAIDANAAISQIPTSFTIPLDYGFVYDQVIAQTIDYGMVI